ncbi:bifunctional UDP-N-acetylglucosamine diphosphorylase/glucosamine-1-phosphate N-acetyltransferase GlmU [Magnetospirillum sp. SS-4]|uniref:bifunctional UDP-N-acetylglucosamine diphosphorylase/glucosamine-1-phosphate N-acetyltransferase GlmU n=1 Tax=Magnetospirillum sp. SS-4 TaxID=2681465 RepID=UPI001383CA53|nr:bifunctional UDP-N-acetylglucosamine diphosphorylase/glucosamine-1-phosphate N-acetyltransferase GlmU [Magnetospirillum sp. SS-4]CAA7612512.1 fused N-acetyl glucosamine-1-phosphate uridyltransferase; glucosamine-1-phosphate acetyl transferase [Magnetospirillum sp. SS-4]
MASSKLAVILLAAGMGTRMKSALPKVMHPIAGRPMISHLLDTVSGLSPDRMVVVVGPEMERITQAVAPIPTVVQAERLGTGHAVAQAREVLRDFDGDVLVLYGDTPLIARATLERLLAERRGPHDPAVVVLGFKPDDPGHYGRLVVGAEGLKAIVEYRDANHEQRDIRLCNSGVLAIDGKRLWSLIDRIDNKNAKGEYYLTDVVALARSDGANCRHVEGAPMELLGVNSRSEQAVAEAVVQNLLRERAMEAGATLIDPQSVWFSWDTRLGKDVTVWPHVVFGPGVVVGDTVEIKGFCHFEGCTIADGAVLGPFARLRPGADIGEAAHIGNFVEVKKAVVETGAKINHLTYIGDARVGAGANVGAGTITCNYDGFHKSFTDIGKGAFIGSNSALVAPVRIGDGAVIGAGSVITKEVTPGALAVARGSQMELAGWADRFRAQNAVKKD